MNDHSIHNKWALLRQTLTAQWSKPRTSAVRPPELNRPFSQQTGTALRSTPTLFLLILIRCGTATVWWRLINTHSLFHLTPSLPRSLCVFAQRAGALTPFTPAIYNRGGFVCGGGGLFWQLQLGHTIHTLTGGPLTPPRDSSQIISK